MSGRCIDELARPPEEHRIDKDPDSGLETKGECKKQLAIRVTGLRRPLTMDSELIDPDEAERLAEQLKHSEQTGRCSISLVDNLYMRMLRIRIAGWLLLLLSRMGALSATVFTIVPKSWEFTPEELEGADPLRLLAAFRSALYAKGAAAIDGWLIAFIHGEFDPVARMYRLHLHGLCSLTMVKAIDALRKDPNYKAERLLPNGEWNPVYRRVWVARKPLTNLARTLSYLVQSFWPSRPIYVSADGKRRRVRDKQRIPEPYHSQVLLWLDRYRLRDLTLMIGLRVTTSGLKRTQRGS